MLRPRSDLASVIGDESYASGSIHANARLDASYKPVASNRRRDLRKCGRSGKSKGASNHAIRLHHSPSSPFLGLLAGLYPVLIQIGPAGQKSAGQSLNCLASRPPQHLLDHHRLDLRCGHEKLYVIWPPWRGDAQSPDLVRRSIGGSLDAGQRRASNLAGSPCTTAVRRTKIQSESSLRGSHDHSVPRAARWFVEPSPLQIACPYFKAMLCRTRRHNTENSIQRNCSCSLTVSAERRNLAHSYLLPRWGAWKSTGRNETQPPQLRRRKANRS